MRFLITLLLFLYCCSGNEKQVVDVPYNNLRTNRLLLQGSDALKQHNFMQALALADSADKYAVQKADIHFFKGRVYSELGRFSEAEQAYKNALKAVPGYRGALNNLGNNAYRQQNFSQAIDYYIQEVTQNQAPIPLRALGRAFVELGKTDSARTCFQKAIDLDMNYAAAYFNLAQLEEDEGNFKQALQHAGRAYGIEPDNLEYRYVYSTLLVQMDRGSEAIYNLRKIVEKWPWHHGAHYNLGRALIQAGQKTDGENYIEQAERVRAVQAKIDHLENTVRALPDDPYSYAALAFALRKVGRYNDAMHSYKVALYLDPGNFDIWNNVANLYLLQGDTITALSTYNYIVDRNPALTDIWLNMGVVYALSNQKEKARSAWKQVLAYQSENAAALNYLKKINGN
jgi:tetratricopeptide (TPR) repeat protein